MNKRCSVPVLILSSLFMVVANSTSVEANHRRQGYGGMATSPYGRHCHPAQVMQPYLIQPASPQVQSAGIPPALIPILMNVGQDVGAIALERLLQQIRAQLNQGDFGSQLNQSTNPNLGSSSQDLQSLQTRLDALEKKINGGQPPTQVVNPQPNEIRKGSVEKPTGQPAFFPRF